MLDVVIGVVFVWFLLSGLISVVNEGFSLATHARAKHLWLGIGRLVDPGQSPLPRRLLDIVYRLPFSGRRDVRPVVPDPDPQAAPTPGDRATVPGRWAALTSERTRRSRRRSPERAGVRSDLQTIYAAALPQVVDVAEPGRLSKLTHVAGDVIADGLLRVASPTRPVELRAAADDLGWPDPKVDALEALLADLPDTQDLDLQDLRDLQDLQDQQDGEAPADLDEPDLRALVGRAQLLLSGRDVEYDLRSNRALTEALQRAVGTLTGDERVAAARRVAERWFDHEMAQLTVFYRRQARKVMALLALPVVVLFHANAIALVQELHDDAVLRQAVVNEAVTAGAAESLEEAVQTACTTSTTSPDTDADPVEAATDQLACARRIVDDAAPLHAGLAIDELEAAHGDPEQFEAADVWPYLRADCGIVGRGLTLVALLFGAQFWFDLLRRLGPALRTMAHASTAR